MTVQIKNHSLEMTITQTGNITAAASQPVNFAQTASSLSPAPVVSGVQPYVKFVNVQLCGKIAAGEGRTGTSGTLLLENPAGQNLLSEDRVLQQVSTVY